MSVTLETLEMTPPEREACRDAVRKRAYFNWLDAGCPDCREFEFWLAAERNWIEHNYVPHRTLDPERSQPGDELTQVRVNRAEEKPSPSKPRRRKRARVEVQ